MDQATIIQKCQQGEFEHFTVLFDEYHKKIYDFVYFRTHHKETAEDLTGQIFTKALEHIRDFDYAKGKFSTWLYQIARNAIIDHYRSYKETQNIDDVWDIAANNNIERDADTAAALEKVRNFLRTLPEQQRDVIIMRVWDGLTHKEISEILGITEANSKMTFSRGIAKINKEIVLSLVFLLTVTIR